MAAQQGFVYEQNTYDYLKPLGFVPTNFTPAGAGHDQPDLMLKYKRDGGSVILKKKIKKNYSLEILQMR